MAEGTTLLDEVSVTAARQMRQYYDNVVHGKRPLLMTRYREPGAVVMPREDLALMLRRYQFTLDVLPEDDGSFTLWVPELGIGESGKTLREARRALLGAVRAYVRHYWSRYEVWRHIHDKSAQWPYILRLSLAQNDHELLGMLLESVPQPPVAQEPVDA